MKLLFLWPHTAVLCAPLPSRTAGPLSTRHHFHPSLKTQAPGSILPLPWSPRPAGINVIPASSWAQSIQHPSFTSDIPFGHNVCLFSPPTTHSHGQDAYPCTLIPLPFSPSWVYSSPAQDGFITGSIISFVTVKAQGCSSALLYLTFWQ